MQTILSHLDQPHTDQHRWFPPASLCGIVLAAFVALSGGTAGLVARDAVGVDDARAGIASVSAVRAEFLHARAAEQDGAPTGEAVRSLRRALDTLPEAGRAGDELRALRTAVETYVQAVAGQGPVAQERLTSPAAVEAIDAVLGRLRAQDEASLREPLVGMRLAEKAIMSGGDPWSKRQLSRWAALFSTRLDEVTIPRGTRAELAGMLVQYEHGVLSDGDAGGVLSKAALVAAHGVETALAQADLALAAEIWHRDGTARERHWGLASVLSGADGLSGLPWTVCGRLSACASPPK